MCGLVSIVSKQKNGIYQQDVKIFTEMLFADQLRGSDGTGIIYNNNKKNVIKTLKAPIASSDFVNTKEYDDVMGDIVISGNFVVGHNRAATKGKLIHDNTHPFVEKHITLVHNGTLPQHMHLAAVEVDSHAICISIANNGYKETLKKINGAFALIWVDSKQKTLNFVRNSQRPLWIVETPFLYIFVSEPELAKWICARNNMKVESCTEVPVNTLHQFVLGEWDKLYTETVSTYTPPSFVNYVPQNTIHTPVTHTVPSSKPVESDPQIGDTIKYITVGVDKDNKNKLIGEWEDSKTGELVEVRFWANTAADAARLLEAKVPLLGKLSHIAYIPSQKEKYFIMSTSYTCAPEVKQDGKEYKSHNGITLTYKDLRKLEQKCSCCNTKYGINYVKDNIKDIDIHLIDNVPGRKVIIEYTCPDCVSWLGAYGEPYNRYSHHGV